MGKSLGGLGQLAPMMPAGTGGMPGGGMQYAPNQYAFNPYQAYGSHTFGALVPNFAPFAPGPSPVGTPSIVAGTKPFGPGNKAPGQYSATGMKPPKVPAPMAVPGKTPTTPRQPGQPGTIPDRGGGGGRNG